MGRGPSRHPQPSCSGIADFAAIILATRSLLPSVDPREAPQHLAGQPLQPNAGPLQQPLAPRITASTQLVNQSLKTGGVIIDGHLIFPPGSCKQRQSPGC